LINVLNSNDKEVMHLLLLTGERVAANALRENIQVPSPEQSVAPFPLDQYVKLLAMINTHYLQTSIGASRDSTTSVAMLVGKVFCFSTSKPDF